MTSDTNERALAAELAGRYRIERELGAGGMATVYLAEDVKHDRMVAVKVLKPELAVAIGAERFLAEIKTTANLQHPHILALHDSGTVNGTVFYVMPYVEGESLRDRLEREQQLPVDDALRIAGEVADALQYAHERGVIHRDIKPENILLQRGHAVVADFGIALAASKTGGARMTETGMSLGTPTYMSPEQAMGAREIDARSDVYSLGCVLYEMLAGEPPFVGPTAQSIVAKVVTETPKGLTAQRHTVPPHVDAAVQRALEKLAADRFPSAGAFAEALRNAGAPVHHASPPPVGATSRSRIAAGLGAATLIAAAAATAAYAVGNRSGAAGAFDGMSIQQRTYRTQSIFTARYSTSGESFVYSAAEGGNSPRIYAVSSAYPEPRAISDSATHLLAVSSKDELAVLVATAYGHHRVFTGTLARMPIGGGTPRELLAAVHDADWSPDGSQLAVVHDVGGHDRLEFPIGTLLYETPGYLSDVRIARDGRHIAFTEHPEKGDDRGFVAMVDLAGAHTTLTPQYVSIEGLAWMPDGKRLVFGAEGHLEEVTMQGTRHRSLIGAGGVWIGDIARDGRQLIIRGDDYQRLLLKRATDSVAVDMSWLNLNFFPQLSGDGSLLAFGDGSNLAGVTYATMLRRTDGSSAVRLGEGAPLAISRDKRWVLSAVPTEPVQLMMFPTGVGVARRLDQGQFAGITAAAFVGDGREFLVCGNEPKRPVRCLIGAVAGGPLRTFVTANARTWGNLVVSPDGLTVIVLVPDSGYRQVSVRDGSMHPVAGLTNDDDVLRFSPDGRSLWTVRENALPVRVERVELASGARSALLPPFAAVRPGLTSASAVSLADDPRNHAYIEREYTSSVFEMAQKR